MSDWHAKATGGYARDSTEALDNATMLANVLTAEGWSVEAISAMLGNGAGESGLNPWRWESDHIPTVAEYQGWSSAEAQHHGYGMWQFTPASKYIATSSALTGYGPNFADRPGLVTDGAAQTEYFRSTVAESWSHGLHDYYADNFAAIGVDIDTFYNMSYAEFMAGTGYTLDQLTGAFELCYERPGDTYAAASYRDRCSNAAYWYEYFSGHPPAGAGLPIWLLKYYVNHKRRCFR